MKRYYVEIFAFEGECSHPLCESDSKDAAILIAKTLAKHGEFKGLEILSGLTLTWKVRVLETEDSDVDVIWEEK